MGIQFAGSHLQELQRAFKNPSANLGLIFSEAGRRASAAVGLARAPVAPLVAPPFVPHAQELAKLVGEYGRVVEGLLVAHGRGVVDRQFQLNRLASAAIDAYATASVLSRASRAASRALPAAAHEARLAGAWAEEALARLPCLLAAARASKDLKHYDLLAKIGTDVAEAGGQPSINPLSF